MLVNDIKLNKQSTGMWITTTGKANVIGKQGAKHPSAGQSNPSTNTTVNMDPSVPAYLYKPSKLAQK